ncbi:unnamed protein product [Effrenium voratum]|uniref:Uncharacterized protein n=1 Tax=Effrenium voratum TaxID=2562239 RepID=A0AA36NDD2_9DINO|nr:unnamed protein product [Effrenium voratum]
MEVLVEAAEGVPSDAVLSLRLGNLRRQAPLSSALMHPLRFATSLADACEPLRIDVLRPVATARQVLRQEELRYTVPLEGMQDMAVRLSVRPTERSACDTDADAQPPSHDAAARDYLEQHKVLQYLQSMLHALIQAKPPDPFSYMVSQLSNAQQPPRRRKASWPERAQREPTCQELELASDPGHYPVQRTPEPSDGLEPDVSAPVETNSANLATCLPSSSAHVAHAGGSSPLRKSAGNDSQAPAGEELQQVRTRLRQQLRGAVEEGKLVAAVERAVALMAGQQDEQVQSRRQLAELRTQRAELQTQSTRLSNDLKELRRVNEELRSRMGEE